MTIDMYLHPIFLPAALLLVLSCSCQPKPQAGEAGGQASTTSAGIDTIDFGKAYRQYFEARENWLPAHSPREAGKLYPLDEALQDTVFFVFRERLRKAVAEKDVFTLLDMLDENVKVDFGGGSGVADFVKAWSLNSEENIARSLLWPVLDRILAMGGTFSEGGQAFTAPYVFSRWPDELDPFTHAAVIGQGVRLRARPDLESRIVKPLSYELVEIRERTTDSTTIAGEAHPWFHVRTRNGLEGFVWGRFVYSPISYRMGFYRDGAQSWKVRFLLAGD